MQAPWTQGTRIVLREFRPSDLAAVQAYAGDPEVTRHMDWGPNDRAASAAFLRLAATEAAALPRVAHEMAVTLRDSGELVGGARIAVRSAPHQRGEIGYVLRRDVWGQGIATEVARLLVAYGFGALRLHRIEATCSPANIASRRVLEKIGMQLEGLRREDLWVRGSWRDSLLFAVLAEDGS